MQVHQDIASLRFMRNRQRHRCPVHRGAALRRVAVAMRDLPVTRPNKFFDAAALEKWIADSQSKIFYEWAFSEAVEWIDFWDWLDREYPEVLDSFTDWYRRQNRYASTRE